MRHFTVLAAGLVTSTLVASICSAQSDQSADDQSPAEHASQAQSADQAQPSDQAQASDQSQTADRTQATDETPAGDQAQTADQAQTGDQTQTGDQVQAANQTQSADQTQAADQPRAVDQKPADQQTQPDQQAQSSDASTPGSAAAPGNSSAKPSAADSAADQDFGRLSSDGANAFEDIHLARVAIFDGNTDEAAELISDAVSSLDKATTDNTAFLKAESALNAPSDPHASMRLNHPKDTNSIRWLPIDAQIAVGETYKSTADKGAAMATARKSLRSGDADQALKAIRLAGIDVDYTMALAPLQQTIADVTLANRLIGDHDYYAASQALKQAEDGIRYDEIDDVAKVKGDNAKTAAAGKNSG